MLFGALICGELDKWFSLLQSAIIFSFPDQRLEGLLLIPALFLGHFGQKGGLICVLYFNNNAMFANLPLICLLPCQLPDFIPFWKFTRNDTATLSCSS